MDEIICYCSNVTKRQIVAAIEGGAKNIDDIRRITSACTIGDCKNLSPRKKCCSPEIMKLLKQYAD